VALCPARAVDAKPTISQRADRASGCATDPTQQSRWWTDACIG